MKIVRQLCVTLINFSFKMLVFQYMLSFRRLKSYITGNHFKLQSAIFLLLTLCLFFSFRTSIFSAFTKAQNAPEIYLANKIPAVISLCTKA